MDFLNFPTVALAAALISLIGVTIYAMMQRGSIRNRDEQLVVARAQAYAMLELSHAGVLFLDREHKLMGEASAAAPELLGHTCPPGTAFVQVIAELVHVNVRRETVAYLEALWKAEPTASVDATQNPLARIHSGSRHLAIRFSRLVVDGRVHHIIVSIERISAPRLVPQTIEVPVLNEETFARRLAGETGTRPGLTPADIAAFDAAAAPAGTPEPLVAISPLSPGATIAPLADEVLDVGTAEQPMPAPPAPVTDAPPIEVSITTPTVDMELGPLDVTEDKLPQLDVTKATEGPLPLSASLPTNKPAELERHLATTITSPEAMGGEKTVEAPPREPDPAAIIDPPDPRLNEVLKEIMHVDAARLEHFLSEARDKAGQLRAIIKLPAREPQAFREKLVLILELIRGIHARAERLPLPSVCDRAARFETALNALRDKQTLSGNDFLPLAVKLDDLLSHLAILGEVVQRLATWRTLNGSSGSSGDGVSIDATQRSATATGTTIRQPKLPRGDDTALTANQPGAATQKAARLSDLSPQSLEEMSQFLADMYSKRVSLVVVGLEDVPGNYRRTIEKILGQLIHNAIRHGLETPADRVVLDKPEIGTVAVQFQRVGADGYQLSVQDDGRGLDHDKIRREAVRQGVLTADVAATIDARKLASLIFRPGFTTVGDAGARGIGMDVVRELVTKAGGRVGIATKPGEYTRFRITLPHEKKNSNARVA
ncbi:MAG TPA: ATP-binding protein [Steroidobacteraceae bacterium]|nr:ATP-binding protein [Steroidobacteraceae bacterium]